MPANWPWIERHFTFDFPVTKHPDIVGRLRGTPPRGFAVHRRASRRWRAACHLK